MEVFEAMGTRRSIRFFKPWQEVEEWKIQKMLQAARHASCQGNCGATEAIVIDKRTYPEDKFEKIVECGSTFNEQPLRQAPIVIAWLINMDAWYKELVESFSVLFPARAVTAAYGWTYKILTETTYPRLMSFPKEKAEDLLRIEAGIAIANAQIAATNMGLGTCLLATGRKPSEFPKALGTPDNIVPIWLMAVGYAAETPGQRPRKRFDKLFHSNVYGSALEEDQEVKKQLEEAKLIQPKAPHPGRDEELKHLCKMFGLDERMPDMPKEKIRELYKEESIYYGEVPEGLEDKGV